MKSKIVIDLRETGYITIKYRDQTYTIVPVQPPPLYLQKYGISNIRIFRTDGGGIRTKPTMPPNTPFLLRMTEPDGSPTNYDTRIQTTCIELQATLEERRQ